MTSERISTLHRTKRIKLTMCETIDYYAYVLFLLFIPACSLYSIYQIYISHTYTGAPTATDWAIVGFPWIIPAIIYYIIQKRSLNFKEFTITHTTDQFKEALIRTTQQLECTIKNKNIHFARVERPGNWISNGEIITIIRTDNLILINSLCTLKNVGFHSNSIRRNKKNIKTFLANLKDVIAGLPAPIIKKEDDFLTANEWSVKRSLVRIIIYPFCIFMIVFGGYMTVNKFSISNIYVGLMIIILATIYIYSDLRILFMKKQKKKLNMNNLTTNEKN